MNSALYRHISTFSLLLYCSRIPPAASTEDALAYCSRVSQPVSAATGHVPGSHTQLHSTYHGIALDDSDLQRRVAFHEVVSARAPKSQTVWGSVWCRHTPLPPNIRNGAPDSASSHDHNIVRRLYVHAHVHIDARSCREGSSLRRWPGSFRRCGQAAR